MGRKQKGVIARGESIQISFMYRGERCRETLRIPPTPANFKYAASVRTSALLAIEKGTFDYADHFPTSKHAMRRAKSPASVITIESALKDWLRRQQITCARSTIRDYTSAVYHHLIPRFGSQVLSELNPGEIRDWTATLKISPKRINNILIPLRGITSEAFYNETIERDPLQRVRNLVLEHRDPHPFTRMEVSAILKVLDGQSRNVIQFAFATGLRTSELIALRWGDVDLADRKVHIRRAIVRNVEKEPKTSSGRRSIELDDSALASLQQQIDFTFGTSEWVFHDPCNDTRWRDDSAIRKRVWIPALKRAGIRYRNPYQTRHTFASTHLSDGKNPMWVAYQLGHRDWGMIRKVYGRWLAS